MQGYYCQTCPECDAENLISTGDVSDCTIDDPEDFKCWQCGKTSRVPKYDGDDVGEDEEDEDDDYEGMEADMPPQSYVEFAKDLIFAIRLPQAKQRNFLELLLDSIGNDKNRHAAIKQVMKKLKD